MSISAQINSWHARPELVARWLEDFIVWQMRQLRANYVGPDSFIGLMLNRDDTDIDSIELIDVASALYVALDAEASGSLDARQVGAVAIGRSFASWCAFVVYAAARTEFLSFYTSGSTGKPRRFEHRPCDLDAEISDFLPQLCAGGFVPKRIVTVMPAQHLYGYLFGILLPAQLNLPLLALKGQAPPMVRAQLAAGDVVIAHPNFWSGALMPNSQAGARNNSLWPSPLVGVSSGQTLPDAVLFAAEVKQLRMLDIYGSTETAGIAWRDAPGPMQLMARYGFSESSQLIDHYHLGRAVTVPDQLEQTNDGRLRVLARHDRVVQVAGVNVYLEHVEQVIREVSCIPKVQVGLDFNTQRLSAWLVSDEIDELELRQRLQARLSSAELPTRWHFVPTLPGSGGWKAG